MPEGRASHPKLEWRTPRRCDAGACVQIAESGQMILVADSKAPRGPIISYTRSEFREFIQGVKSGDFDDLIQ